MHLVHRSRFSIRPTTSRSSVCFPILRTLINELASHCQVELPEELQGDQLDFGTDDPAIFLKFLEGLRRSDLYPTGKWKRRARVFAVARHRPPA